MDGDCAIEAWEQQRRLVLRWRDLAPARFSGSGAVHARWHGLRRVPVVALMLYGLTGVSHVVASPFAIAVLTRGVQGGGGAALLAGVSRCSDDSLTNSKPEVSLRMWPS